ncbi:ATP-binding cassette glutathione S-conjugate transporter ycf1 [Coemansia sp. RSA 485]|nr:ATP-binding cassette glutathione S-conjugate transporter ycf1 [Coemansia sp. RSA 485]
MNLANGMDNLELRVKQLANAYIYTEELEHEAPAIIQESRPEPNWPTSGAIEFRNYNMRYRPELELVLKDLSFSVKGREKIGICGRTGAGKSSLTYALMRLVEAEQGQLLIDGLDTLSIGVNDLRSKISIIPQDPVLYIGTIRENLDPREEYTDDEVQQAINACRIGHLLETPTKKPDDINANGHSYGIKEPWTTGTGLAKWVEKDGSNFSVGQRQLVSMCRALLWKRRIVVLDEATANIDSKTDRVMQEIIRQEFKDCTVLTIAHRLNTIMDSDRVLVMDKGQVAEFDTPAALLADKQSHFARLVESMRLNQDQS